MKNNENFNIFPNSDDNDRTTAFTLERKERRPDSVIWIISGLVIFFLNVISIARITIIGQFLDDVIFTLPFGWFKYFLYLLFFIIDFAIYFGIKFKPKKRFIAMIFLTWIMLCWIITSIMLIVIHYTHPERPVDIFTSTIFKDTISWFWDDWKSHSVFNGETTSWIISPKENFLTPFAGGGMIGAFLAGIGAYLSIFGGLILALICFFINMIWIFTGDPFYLFKPKHKRKPKRLRILSLKSKNVNQDKFYLDEEQSKKTKKHKKKFGSFFQTVNVSDDFNSDRGVIIQNMRESDITIELPSFVKSSRHDEFYEEKSKKSQKEKHSTTGDLNSENDYVEQMNNLRNYEIGNRGYVNVVDNSKDYPNQNFYPNSNQQNEFNEWNELKQFDVQSENQFQDFNQNNFGDAQNLFDYPNKTSIQNQIPNPVQNPNQNLIYPKRMQNENNVLKKSTTPYNEEYIGDVLIGNGVTKDEARRIFDMERNVSPYGANGKTVEMINSLHDANKPKQITLDEVIEDTKFENEHREQKRRLYDDYVNPIENTYSKTMIMRGNPYQVPTQNHKIQVPQQIAEKEVFVNNNYRLPTNQILDKVIINQEDIKLAQENAQKKGAAINQVFKQFNVNAKVTKIIVGSSVTKFEVHPEIGTKVNSITNLENEFKFALASQNVIVEAPIQGKSAIGIEIPNEKPTVVPLRSVLENIPYNKINTKLFFGIGKNVYGDVLFGELDRAPHLLVAGSTGSGKSVMINAIICSILMRAKPHEVKFLMIDPKKVELSIYATIPHLLAPVISDMALANSALKKVVNEMERRYTLFEKNAVKNLEGYNSKIRDPKKQLPYYVIVIDELADLMMTGNKREVEDSIMRLTQMARAAGIHLIVATQRPSTDVITGVIKTNIPTRISFAVASGIDSRTILDASGADKLNGKGDLLYLTPGSNTLTRAQGAFISDKEIQNLVNFISHQQEQFFDDEFLRVEIENSGVEGGGKDALFDSVKEYVIREQRASTSLIQRVFSIGYNRAAKIIDELEYAGVIGPQNGAKAREVFIKNQDIIY